MHRLKTRGWFRTSATGRASANAGQAVIEFTLIVVLLIFVTFGSIDLGIHIATSTRMAGAARAGALALTPSNIVGSYNDVPLRARNDVYISVSGAVDYMNSELATNGQVIISFLVRNPDVSTGDQNDLLRIERQYVFKGDGTTGWPSKFGVGPASDPGDDYEYTMIPDTIINPEVVNRTAADWVVLVEVFHPPVVITPMATFLNFDNENRIGVYEYTLY